jgi:hypothetical protein
MPEQDELTVDLPSEGQSVSVSVESPIDDSENRSAPSDTEHEDYSKKVKKRIDRLTKKAREAERQQDAALQYARNIQAENQELKNRVQNLDQGYVAEYGDHVATQTEVLQRDLETAIATSDTAAQVDLNKRMTQLAIEEERVKAAKLQQAQLAASVESQRLAMAQQTPQQIPQQVPVRPDPKAEDWASRNDWFGEDEAMTFAAFGIHKTLVEGENFDTETPEYYDEVDKRMREAFPHKFNEGEQVPVSESRRPQQAVASATRSSGSGRRTVRLSPSEVAIAGKLGVPLDEYAKYKR